MKIADIVTDDCVTIPVKHLLLSQMEQYWGRLFDDREAENRGDGLIGLGEMGRWGESAESAIRSLKPYLAGHDSFDLEALRFKIGNHRLYNNRTPLLV